MIAPSKLSPRALLIIAIAVGALLAIVSLIYQHARSKPVLDPAVHDSVTALRTSRQADSVAHANAITHAETVYVASAHAIASSDASAQHAHTLHAQGDSLAQLAHDAQSAHDSASYYASAWRAERARGDSLVVSRDSARAAAIEAQASALSFKRADSVSQFRLARVERVNAQLVSEVARITNAAQCRLLPGIPCPSRKLVAVTSAAAGYYLSHR